MHQNLYKKWTKNGLYFLTFLVTLHLHNEEDMISLEALLSIVNIYFWPPLSHMNCRNSIHCMFVLSLMQNYFFAHFYSKNLLLPIRPNSFQIFLIAKLCLTNILFLNFQYQKSSPWVDFFQKKGINFAIFIFLFLRVFSYLAFHELVEYWLLDV